MRVELYVEKLTSDEKAVLDAMRQNYDSQVAELNSLREFKANYDMAEKQSVMDKWATKIGNTQEFAELTADEQFKNYAVEELETKCKCIFADNTAFSCNFAATSKPAIAGMFSVPGQSPFCWPPPNRIGFKFVFCLTNRAPTPLGALILWPEIETKSAGMFGKLIGSFVNDCTQSR